MSSHSPEERIEKWLAEPETQKLVALFRESGYRLAERWQRGPEAARPQKRRLIWVFAVVAAFAAAAAALHRYTRPGQPQEVFVRIPFVVPAAPYERTEIVRMDVPVAALIAAGFPINQAAAAQSVPADVLLGQDGRALAVSLLKGEMNP